MKDEINLRAFTRIPTKVKLALRRIATGERLSGYTQNVSMKGFAVEGIPEIPVGEIVDVVFLIGGPDSVTKVEVKARIANFSGNCIGAEILSHMSMESYGHLKRLVLYRSGDGAELIEGEIACYKDKV